TGHQDIHFSEDAFAAGKKFCNKIWNAARFVLLNKPSRIDFGSLYSPHKFSRMKNLSSADKKILKDLDKIIRATDKHLEKFEFGQALHNLYEFFWHDFCDRYIEATKKETASKFILLFVLANSLKLLHPFIPFVTEEIYQIIQAGSKRKKLLLIEKYPN
ncbi:MAG: class I tRNA ligase family protein, partial [bacterium]|nr:class I tRNA ligase family protein [bacterium]